MGRTISDDEAAEAAWNVQLPSLKLDMPLANNDSIKQLRAARGARAYADIGVWLQLCSIATSYKGHALPLDYGQIADWLFGNSSKSTIAAGHVNALATAGLAIPCDDGRLYLPVIEAETVRHGKMIVGGSRGGRPQGKRKRRR